MNQNNFVFSFLFSGQKEGVPTFFTENKIRHEKHEYRNKKCKMFDGRKILHSHKKIKRIDTLSSILNHWLKGKTVRNMREREDSMEID